MRKLTFLWRIVLILLFIPLTASCSNDETDRVIDPVFSLRSHLSSLTRADFSEQASIFNWQKEDQIGFYYIPEGSEKYGVYNMMLSFVKQESGNSAVFGTERGFEWQRDAFVHNYYAVYPYKAGSGADPASFAINVSQSQTQEDISRFYRENSLLVAKSTVYEYSRTEDMEFTTPLALLKLNIDARGSVVEREIFSSLKLAAHKNVAGEARYDFINSSVTEGTAEEIQGVLSASLTLSQNPSFRFFILPVLDQDEEISILFSNNSLTAEAKFILPEKSQANAFYDIDLNMEELYHEGKLTVTSNKQPSVVENTANCFMVLPGNSVDIPVKKAWGIWDNYFNIGLEGEVTCELLWQDSPDLISEVSLLGGDQGESSVIKVKTSSSAKGNAMVAVRVNGEIRWSWHIWVVDYAPDNTYSHNNGVETFVFMDRNLGAVNTIPGDPESVGYFYQWGRKDPFPPGKTTVSEQSMVVYDINGNILKENDESSPGSICYVANESYRNLINAVRHPNYFYSNGMWKTWGADYYRVADWQTNDFSLMIEDLWNSSTRGKTVFDPCPDGWRVPSASVSGEEYYSPWHGATGRPTTTKQDNVYPYGEGQNVDNLGYYPATGFRDFEDGSLVNMGMVAYMWLGNIFYAEHNITGELVQYTMATDFWHSGGIQAMASTPFRAHGMSVRCVKE